MGQTSEIDCRIRRRGQIDETLRFAELTEQIRQPRASAERGRRHQERLPEKQGERPAMEGVRANEVRSVDQIEKLARTGIVPAEIGTTESP